MPKHAYVRATRSMERCAPLGVDLAYVQHKAAWMLPHPYKEGLIAIIVYNNRHILRYRACVTDPALGQCRSIAADPTQPDGVTIGAFSVRLMSHLQWLKIIHSNTSRSRTRKLNMGESHKCHWDYGVNTMGDLEHGFFAPLGYKK